MNSELLNQVWYMALLSEELQGKDLHTQEVCGEPVIFFRDETGQVKALRNICPHRGIPLSYGRLVNHEVECPYHGWKFNGGGVCTEIPSLTKTQNLDCRKIKVKNYLTHEQYGQIWIFIGDPNGNFKTPPKIPAMSFLSDRKSVV